MTQERIAGIVLAVIAAVSGLFPDKVYELTEKWKSSEETQPSGSYRLVMRLVSAVFAGTAVYLLLRG